MKQFVALVDCNNFYVSCERLFRVALRNKPVIVLSNNDSCVVARSNEVKKLNIKMGTPLFQIRHLMEQHDIQVFSSNYALYADVSNRVMHVLLALALASEEELDTFLSAISIEDVWSIGPRYARFLHDHRIITARHLKYADLAWIRKH